MRRKRKDTKSELQELLERSALAVGTVTLKRGLTTTEKFRLFSPRRSFGLETD